MTPGTVYVRCQRDQSRLGRTAPPLTPEHAHYAASCVNPTCSESLGNGQSVALLIVGPEDADDRQAHHQGRWYSAAAAIGHTRCLGADSDD